ncbi:protein of unknown function [Pseudomonas mediterranea]
MNTTFVNSTVNVGASLLAMGPDQSPEISANAPANRTPLARWQLS